jgi:arsenate reductase
VLLMRLDLARRLAAEALGTAMLLAAIVGSGIMASRLSSGDAGLQLLENALATAAVLGVAIAVTLPISGAHLNPIVTLVSRVDRSLTTSQALCYVASQLVGAVCGVVIANLMFDLPAVGISSTGRSSAALWLGEAVATFGLVLLIIALVRSGRSVLVPIAVGVYILGAYWFTSSTSFANPAVTVGRTLTDTFSGIAPASVPGFVVAQLVGGLLGFTASGLLYPTTRSPALPVSALDGQHP